MVDLRVRFWGLFEVEGKGLGRLEFVLLVVLVIVVIVVLLYALYRLPLLLLLVPTIRRLRFPSSLLKEVQ